MLQNVASEVSIVIVSNEPLRFDTHMNEHKFLVLVFLIKSIEKVRLVPYRYNLYVL